MSKLFAVLLVVGFLAFLSSPLWYPSIQNTFDTSDLPAWMQGIYSPPISVPTLTTTQTTSTTSSAILATVSGYWITTTIAIEEPLNTNLENWLANYWIWLVVIAIIIIGVALSRRD